MKNEGGYRVGLEVRGNYRSTEQIFVHLLVCEAKLELENVGICSLSSAKRRIFSFCVCKMWSEISENFSNSIFNQHGMKLNRNFWVYQIFTIECCADEKKNRTSTIDWFNFGHAREEYLLWVFSILWIVKQDIFFFIEFDCQSFFFTIFSPLSSPQNQLNISASVDDKYLNSFFFSRIF